MLTPDAKLQVGVVDYGMGNSRSVVKAFEKLGIDVTVCSEPKALAEVDRIVLPGVGAFGDGMRSLRDLNFIEALEKQIFQRGVPLLGICLGMELMSRSSTEGGYIEGLGWFDADVTRLQVSPGIRVPHIGWNDVEQCGTGTLLEGVASNATFYFNHSYGVHARDPEIVSATCEHGTRFAAVLESGPVKGCQFHPEKSQDAGRRVLLNFVYRVAD